MGLEELVVCPLSIAIGCNEEHLLAFLGPHDACNLVVSQHPHADDAHGCAPHGPDGAFVVAQCVAGLGYNQDVVLTCSEDCLDKPVVLPDLDGPYTLGLCVAEGAGGNLLCNTFGGAEQDECLVVEVLQVDDCLDLLVCVDAEESPHQNTSRALACHLGNLVNLEPECPALVGDKEDIVVSGGDEQVLHKVFPASDLG